MKKTVEERLFFQTCKEGLFHLHNPPDMDCCGFMLFSGRVGRRPHLWDVYSLVKSKGSLVAEEVFNKLCEDDRHYLCGNRLDLLPSWLRRTYYLHEQRFKRLLLRPGLFGMLTPVLELRNDKIALKDLEVVV